MPSVKRRASRILDEYGAAQSELIGKAVVLTDGKAGAVENLWLDELHRLRISIKGHEGKWPVSTISCGVLDLASAAGYADRAPSKHSNQNEEPDLGQESGAHNRDRKEHVARRERVHECLASCDAPEVNHSGQKMFPGQKMFRFQMQTARDASGAGNPKRPKTKSA
jgi:hypothetical protein